MVWRVNYNVIVNVIEHSIYKNNVLFDDFLVDTLQKQHTTTNKKNPIVNGQFDF